MARVDKKTGVLKVTSSSLSPKDLEAEIAATASAIGGAKTVAGVAQLETTEKKPKKRKAPAKKKSAKKAVTKKTPAKKTPAKKTAPKKKVAEKPAPKKAAKQKKGKVLPTSDVRPRSHSSVKKTVTKATVTVPKEASPSAVKVKITPKGAVVKGETKGETTTLNHRGKDLAPIGATSTKKPATKAPTTKSKPVAVASAVKVQKRPPIHTEKPYEPVKAKPAKTKTAPAATRHKRTPHVARIYDTETYHIPITVDRHHRKAMLPSWAWVLIVVVACVATVAIAISQEIISF